MRNQIKSELIILSALLVSLAEGSSLEKTGFALLVIAVFCLTELLKFALKKHLRPTFQTAFILVSTATFLQLASFQFNFLEAGTAVFLIIPVFLLTLSSDKFKFRMRAIFDYLILTLAVILIQSVDRVLFYALAFLGVAFVSLILKDVTKFLGSQKS